MLIKMLISMIVTYLLGNTLSGIVVETWWVAFVFAALLTILNATVGKLVKFIGCGLQLLTFGLFGLFVNVAILQFVANTVKGIEINSWSSALILSLAISVVSWFTNDRPEQKKRHDRS